MRSLIDNETLVHYIWLNLQRNKKSLLRRLCGNKILWKDCNQTFFVLEMSCFESFNLVVLILTLSRTNGLGSSYDLYARQNYMNLCRVPKKDKVWFDILISFSKKNSTHSTKLLVNLIKIDNCHNNNCNIQRKLFNV